MKSIPVKRDISNRTILCQLLALALLLSLAACQRDVVTPTGSAPTASASATPAPLAQTDTASPPMPSVTATPDEPLAASVNSEGISLAEYNAELDRYRAAKTEANQALPSEKEQQQVVLQELTGQLLLSQAARKAGYQVADAELQARIDRLTGEMGGAQALADWQTKNGYSEVSFRTALRRSAEAAWQRDQILASVPEKVEQVHARQILAYTADEADTLLSKLKSGVDFATLANAYDPLTGGELGWFPRGYLTVPEVEEAAFALQPGEHSQVIQSKVGFHIVQVIEREANHPLSADARLVLQRQALTKWIEDQRASSAITVFLP